MERKETIHNVKIKRHFGKEYVVNSDHSILMFEKKDKLKYLANRIIEESGIDIIKKEKKREAVYLRAIYYKLAIELTKYPYEIISEIVNKDHASVTYGMNTIWPEVEKYRPDLVDLYHKLILDLDDDKFSDVKVLRIKKELNQVKEVLDNVKREIDKEYFSLQQKLSNVKKVAYNENVE